MTAETPPAPPPRSGRPDAGGASTLAPGPRRLDRITTAACLGVIALYVSPLWQSLTTWGGTFDWGYFFFLAEVDRKTVVEFGQFPLWNPYYCGGAVHLANPQTYFLSPTFLFIWAFGTPLGIRLTLTVAILLAMDGMRRFLGVLGIGRVGAVIGGTGYAVSGTIAQHLGGGHVGWLGFCVLPYVLHSFHRALVGQRRHILYGGLFLAWIFGHFGGYTFPYSALTLALYGMIWSACQRRLRDGLVVIAWMLTFGLALSSVRLLPILEFMSGHPRIRPDLDIVSPLEYVEIYLVRHRTRGVPGHPYVWPEYGNYLGLAGAALMALGCWTVARRRRGLRPIAYALLAFLVFQVGNVPGFPWWLLKHLPIFRFMRVPSRFTVLVGLFACALIGIGVDRWLAPFAVLGSDRATGRATREWTSSTRGVTTIAVAVAVLGLAAAFLVDAATFNSEQWFQTLTLPPPQEAVSPAFRQVRGDRHRMYAYPRTNLGTLDCFEEAPLDISPRLGANLPADEYPMAEEAAGAAGAGPGVAGADSRVGTVRRMLWSPNHIVVEADFKRPGLVVVNQNYHPGWRVRGGELVSAGGLLAARVEAGRHTVRFRFLPTSFLVGLGLSVATLIYGVWQWRRWGGSTPGARR
jgi:hypothetical protein